MAEEQGFEVVDRRRVRAEPAAPSQAEAGPPESEGDESEPPSPDAAAPEASAGGTGLPQMDFSVTAILATTINMLHERAWISLGLMPDPFTETIRQDLPEARRAIDILGDLAKHMAPHASAEENRELQNMLATLRANYVRQSGSG